MKSLKQFFVKLTFLEKALIFLILIIFLGSSFYGFPDSPSPWLDEGINVGIAKTWVETGVYSYQLGPDMFVVERPWLITNNYPVILPIAAVFKMFGVGLPQVKIVMFLFLTVFLLVVYKFIKVYSKNTLAALVSILLLVSFLPLYGNGLSGALGELPGIMYLLLGLLFLEKDGVKNAFLAGLFIGLCVATKPLFIPVLLVLFVAEVYHSYREKQVYWQRWWWGFLGLLVPLLVWLRTLFPEPLTLSYLQETLNYYSNSQNTEGQVVKNILVSIKDSTPLHFLFLSLIYFISKFFGKDRAWSRAEIILWGFAIVDVVYYLRGPGWFRHLFPAHLIALIFAGPAIFHFQLLFKGSAIKKYFAATLVTLLFFVQTVHLVNTRADILYLNRVPRHFAENINKLNITEDKSFYLVDLPSIAFMLKHPNTTTYHNYFVNALLRVGPSLFDSKDTYPDYLIVRRVEENDFLKPYLGIVNTNYKVILTEGSFQLFERL